MTIHGAKAWNDAGYKGQGVKIGIIDIGFEQFSNYQGTEVPSTVEAMCYTSAGQHSNLLSDCETSHEFYAHHGTIVTEAVFDYAPEAEYYIGKSYGWDSLRSVVEWMAESDVQILVVSLGFGWSGPGDGTSPFANSPVNTVNYAASQGMLWVAAAGNSAESMWLGNFQDADGDGWHEFQDGDECNSVYMPEDVPVRGNVRWSGTWGEEPDADLDLYIYKIGSWRGAPPATPLMTSEGNSNAIPVPFENVSVAAPESSYYCFAIRKDSGGEVGWMQFRSPTGHIIERFKRNGSMISPAEHPSASLVSVGAAPASDTSTLWESSSRGPTTDGRTKPELVGVHETHSVVYGGSAQGTSFSTPQVGGLAALVLQAHPHYSAAQVAQYLKNYAEARGESPNNGWGYGLAMLPGGDAIPTPAPTETPTSTETPSPTSTPVAPGTPSPTSTPEPTATPEQTVTPEPTPTGTPEPTSTCMLYLTCKRVSL